MITSPKKWAVVMCVLTGALLLLFPEFLCFDCNLVSADSLNAQTFKAFMDKEWGGGKVLMYNAAMWAFIMGVALGAMLPGGKK